MENEMIVKDMKWDVWTIHKYKKISVSDYGSVPVAVTSVLSSAKDPQNPTISEVVFDPDDLRQFDDYADAHDFGKKRAAELGYEFEVESY